MNIKESIKNYIQKIPAFLSGMLVGIIITGSFFLLKINDYQIQLKETLYPKITVIEKETNAKESVKNNKTKKYTNKNNSSNTSQSIQDTSQNLNQEKEIIPVIEEKIISKKEVKIIHLNNNDTDTTLTKIAEIPQIIKDNTIQIIFKKTPFNNKGYYFEDNALVLYGLEDIPYINIYEYNNTLYIKYDKRVFQLSYTNSFQPLIKVEDEHLIAKMN
ncbi:MAG TPA: hypothetical protein PK995_09185 [Bacteroidia bacterium]|nr:hypothetical protein [Bacteroidia bacterium]